MSKFQPKNNKGVILEEVFKNPYKSVFSKNSKQYTKAIRERKVR